jgi:cytochrome c-type biogenesis protein CcmH/NrfG
MQVMKDKARLEDEVDASSFRMRELQAQVASLTREKNEVRDEMERMRNDFLRRQNDNRVRKRVYTHNLLVQFFLVLLLSLVLSLVFLFAFVGDCVALFKTQKYLCYIYAYFYLLEPPK